MEDLNYIQEEDSRGNIIETGSAKISHISEALTRFLNKGRKTSDPKHEKAEIVNEIRDVIGLTKVYSYTYWLSKLKQFEKSGGEKAFWLVRDWLRVIKDYPSDFNKGAILTNKFKKFADEYKNKKPKD